MKPEHVSRYIRPTDIPLLDDAILNPVLQGVIDQLATVDHGLTAAEWHERLYTALLQGELVIVIDDERRRLGIVRTDVPPYAALLQNSIQAATTGTDAADPLGLRGWLNEPAQEKNDQNTH